MKIKILGTRGKIPQSSPDHQQYSGILIDDKILVDIGEEKYLQYNPEAAVFTHFHPDHAFFVFNQQSFTPDFPTFGPESIDLVPDLQVVSETFNIGSFTFTPVPVIHALHLKSLGYLIEKDSKKIFISGDVAWIEKAHLKKLPTLDLIVTEASSIKKGGMIRRRGKRIFGHTGIPDLMRLFDPLTSRIAFVHFGSWFFKDQEASIKQIHTLAPEGLQVIPAHDGLELKI